MQPQEYFDKEQEGRRLAHKICKLNTVSVVYKYDEEKKEGFYDLQVVGCTNERRNGSAYCHPCSDAHHAKQAA
jgi:hypothetical protein